MEAIDQRQWWELRRWRGPETELGMVSIAVEFENMVAYDLAEREQDGGKGSGTKHGALRALVELGGGGERRHKLSSI